jgi:7-cyano-7-deazaguanine reductase
MASPQDSQLGKTTLYKDQYDPALLFPIPRDTHWAKMGIDRSRLPFTGEDLWTGYELSWVNAKGKPSFALAEFRVPAVSPNIIESKSFKLYLNSLNQTAFESTEAVKQVLERDLSAVAGAEVQVNICVHSGEQIFDAYPQATSIDHWDVVCDQQHPNPSLLKIDKATIVEERLISSLLKSNCPVTYQPDWATLFIDYKGPKLDQAALLQYIVSYRKHSDFHEHCVEAIFMDLWHILQQPAALTVYARYTRRGGLDINPYRSTVGVRAPSWRTAYQ